ncbi:MAG: hypothetical protein H6934_08225 [Burkholderiaceae bacterium]|nr:hypothetical protein [Burkholderiaceae bacterium]
MAGTEFTDAERSRVAEIRIEPYGRVVPLQLADTELSLAPGDSSLTTCPTLYWTDGGAVAAWWLLAAGKRCPTRPSRPIQR